MDLIKLCMTIMPIQPAPSLYILIPYHISMKVVRNFYMEGKSVAIIAVLCGET